MSPNAVAVRFSALGDLVLSTGVLEHWQSTLGLQFVFITKKDFSPILENHPSVAEIIALDRTELSGSAWLRQARRLASAYSGLPLIDLHGNLRTRVLRMLWKGKTYSYAKHSLTRRAFHRLRHDWARQRLLQWNVPQRYAMALHTPPPSAKALLPHLYPTRGEVTQTRSLLEKYGFTERNAKPVALHPYATHGNKKWPESHWQKLVALLEKHEIPWLVIGKSNFPATWASGGGNATRHDFTNCTDLRQSCALLASCRALVTGDSGPMHLACGVGTPVVALFGPTTRTWGFYPEGPKDVVLECDLPCRPCSLHGGKTCQRNLECMSNISPEDVLQALVRI